MSSSHPRETGGEGPADRERRKGRPAARRRRRTRGLWLTGGALCLLALCVIALAPRSLRPVHAATVEAGQAPEPGMFVSGAGSDAAFGPGVDAIDTTVPGRYEVTILCDGRSYDTTMKVVDTVPPAGTGKSVVVSYGAPLSVVDCVENVADATQVMAEWTKQPDLEKVGEPQTVVVRLVDAGGNRTDVQAQVTVKYDAVAPVIEGAKDIDAFLGESIAYRDGVTVTDDADPEPTLTIDSSGVNVNAAGVYTATYTATDAAGNSSSAAITVTLREKPEGYVDEQTVYAVAQEYYDAIIDEDMTDMEKAYAIYLWVKGYIDYWDNDNYEYWTMAAYQAFTRGGGDCYNYFAAAKALLNMAGIENIEVDKSDISHSRHYWLLVNLGYGWYHLDPTPRLGSAPDRAFMLTDAELDAYSMAHGNSNVFDPTLYPDRATRSVQEYVDYDRHRVRDPDWLTASD